MPKFKFNPFTGTFDLIGDEFDSSTISSLGYWSPLTDAYVPAPELVFTLGDVIMIWTPTP